MADFQITATPENHINESQRRLKIGSYDVAIEDDKLPYFGVIGASIILMIAVVVGEVKKEYKNYGFSIGCIAIIATCLCLVPNPYIDKYSILLNYFLFGWCFIGACFMTFGQGPFDETGNGYFASWALSVFSAMILGVSNIPGQVRQITAGMNEMIGLGACAIVVLIALMTDFKEWGYYARGEMVFAIITSILTILAVSNFAYARLKGIESIKEFEFPSLAVFACFWIIASCLTTFRGPFLVTSNGYFASWGGTILAVKAAISSKKEGLPDVGDATDENS